MVLVVLVIVVVVMKSNSKPWTLSLYKEGSTLMRLDYPSKETCLSAGQVYKNSKTAERFDCGYKCSFTDRNDLKASPICEPICNEVGCK